MSLSVPNTFTPNTIIFSASMNQNFSYLDNNAAQAGVNGDITSTTAMTAASALLTVGAGVVVSPAASAPWPLKANNLSDLASVATAIVNLSQLLADIATISWVAGDLMYYNGSHLVRLGKGTAGQVLAAGTTPFWQASGTAGLPQPVTTVHTNGTGTHTTAAGATRSWVRMVGGGGGGGGSTGNGGDGGDTTFGTALLTAGKGHGGLGNNSSTGGAGGTASGGDLNLPGSAGPTGPLFQGSTNTGVSGAPGMYGSGAGTGGPNATAGGTNTGAGGGAGGTTANEASGGGGAGAYCEKLIIAPLATYAFAVGAAGAAGTGAGSLAGAAGGSGVIIVTEYFD